MKKTIFFLFYYLIFGIIVLGLYFHKSGENQIFGYSYAYFFGIIIVSLFLLFVLPYLLNRFIKTNGLRALIYSLIPTTFLLGVVYLVFHFKYDVTQYNHFDPYLQIHKTKIDLNEYSEEDFVILCLGGSTTYNNDLPKESRYTSVLEKELNESYPDKNIKVINAGKDWYTTKHSLINYSTYYKKVKPDIVTVMHAVNDLYRSFSPPQYAMGEFKEDYSHFYGPSIHGANPPTYEKYLFKIISSYWFSTLAQKRTAVDYSIEQYKSFTTYKDQLNALVNEIKQDSAQCIIIEQPYLYKDVLDVDELEILRFGYEFCTDGEKYASYTSLKSAMDVFNNSAKNISQQFNCLFVNTQSQMPKSTKYFKDDVHYTESGSIRLGEIIATEIIKAGVIN